MNHKSADNTVANSDSHGSDGDEIREFFDDMSFGRNEAIDSNPVIRYEQELRAQTVLSLLSINPGEHVLDIGCANARDISELVKSGAQVTGVDISESMIDAAKKQLSQIGIDGVTLRVGDATRLNFSDASFDKILCSEVIEHIPDALQALKEIRRVLKRGGALVLSTPNKSSWYGIERYWLWQRLLRRKWPHPYDEWRNSKELSRLLEQSLFTVSKKKTVCFVPGFMATYFVLPRVMQKILVDAVNKIEPLLRKWLPDRGYTICILATRNDK